MKLALLVSLLSLGVAAGAGFYLHGENTDLKARLSALEGPFDEEDEAGAEAGTPGAALRGAGTRREVAQLRRLTNALTDRMTAMEKAAADVPAGATAALDAGALAEKPAFTDAVREVVLDMATNDVDFRARIGGDERTKLAKNSPFTKVAETLKLDASQEAQMSKDLQEMQGELLAVLSEERDDGVVPLEMIAKAEELKQGDPKRGQYFMQLFTLKIPGSEETYMQRAVKMGTTYRKKIEKFLRPEQIEILNAVEIDWFSVKFN